MVLLELFTLERLEPTLLELELLVGLRPLVQRILGLGQSMVRPVVGLGSFLELGALLGLGTVMGLAPGARSRSLARSRTRTRT